MEKKKSDRANLENKRGMFFLLGVILGVSLIVVALEWSFNTEDYALDEVFFDEMVQDLELLQAQDGEDREMVEQTSPVTTQIITAKTGHDETDVPDEQQNTLSASNNGLSPEVEENPEPLPPTPPANVANDSVVHFRIVEQMPEFPGGMTAYMKWLTKNLQYPDIARNQRLQGKVVVQFIVNKDGTIADAKVVKSVTPSLDREAMRVIRMMPAWKPGIQDDKPCRTMIAVPIVFKL
ncbi:MAG: energy transducer TonB [Prevotella sp.]|nr:energy transducer TonB [Prevotella sp.]